MNKLFGFWFNDTNKKALQKVAIDEGTNLSALLNRLALDYINLKGNIKIVIEEKEEVDNSLSEKEEKDLREWEKRQLEKDPDFFKNK